MKIGIDMDDVCADFLKREVEIMHEMFGRPPLGTMPIDWEGSNLQVTPEEYKQFWAKAATVHNLWLDLKPLPSFDYLTRDYLESVIIEHDVYFITNRFPTPGPSPMKQTKAWLWYNAGIEAANVLIAKDKGPVASVLELDAFIDDLPKNCIEVLAARPNAKVFLSDASHNKQFSSDVIPRIKDLKSFLKLILSGVYDE